MEGQKFILMNEIIAGKTLPFIHKLWFFISFIYYYLILPHSSITALWLIHKSIYLNFFSDVFGEWRGEHGLLTTWQQTFFLSYALPMWWCQQQPQIGTLHNIMITYTYLCFILSALFSRFKSLYLSLSSSISITEAQALQALESWGSAYGSPCPTSSVLWPLTIPQGPWPLHWETPCCG